MFTITVVTFSGEKKQYSTINRDLAIFNFNNLMKAIDADKITMIDGLTGEVIYEYSNKKFSVFNGECIGEKWMR